MEAEETSQVYLDGLKKQIEAMDPLDRICATVLVTLGRAIAELLNRRDWNTIEEMKAVCFDLFEQAEEAKDETVDTVQ